MLARAGTPNWHERVPLWRRHSREAIEAGRSPASMACRWQDRVFQCLTHHRTPSLAPEQDGFIVDKEDSSVTRSAEYLEGLFKAGGLNVVRFLQPLHHAVVPHAALPDESRGARVGDFAIWAPKRAIQAIGRGGGRKDLWPTCSEAADAGAQGLSERLSKGALQGHDLRHQIRRTPPIPASLVGSRHQRGWLGTCFGKSGDGDEVPDDARLLLTLATNRSACVIT